MMVPFKIKLQKTFFFVLPLLSSLVSLAVTFLPFIPYNKKGLEYKMEQTHQKFFLGK